jgi:hypothetical protein
MPTRKLTDEQKRKWAIDGYLVLKGALSPTEVKRYRREVDRLYRRVPQEKGKKPKRGLDTYFAIEDSEVLMELIDHPATFDLVVDLMGPNIQISMAEVMVRPPDPNATGYIHTDGGQALRRIRVTETSYPLQTKIQYFLTDLRRPNCGNFTVCPGSHLRPFPEDDPANSHLPSHLATPGTFQLCVEPGDAAIFSHSLWHGGAPNHSKRARKTMIFGYSQMFCRTFGYDRPSQEVLDRCTPRQRRLLGELGYEWRPGAHFYAPDDQIELVTGTKRRAK